MTRGFWSTVASLLALKQWIVSQDLHARPSVLVNFWFALLLQHHNETRKVYGKLWSFPSRIIEDLGVDSIIGLRYDYGHTKFIAMTQESKQQLMQCIGRVCDSLLFVLFATGQRDPLDSPKHAG